jgi:hypothetical protein
MFEIDFVAIEISLFLSGLDHRGLIFIMFDLVGMGSIAFKNCFDRLMNLEMLNLCLEYLFVDRLVVCFLCLFLLLFLCGYFLLSLLIFYFHFIILVVLFLILNLYNLRNFRMNHQMDLSQTNSLRSDLYAFYLFRLIIFTLRKLSDFLLVLFHQ